MKGENNYNTSSQNSGHANSTTMNNIKTVTEITSTDGRKRNRGSQYII